MANVNQHHKKTRMVAVAALVVGVLGLGVAFAALSTTLMINGTAKVGAADWDIRWANLSCSTTGEAELLPAPSISANYQTITIDAQFVAPGDTISCNFNALNNGDIDAKLDHATFVANTSNLASLGTNGVSYTFKYRSNSGGATSGNNVGAASLDLVSGQSHEMQLVMTNNNTALLSTATSPTSFSFSLPYVQKSN
jgi:hypothetical protein